MNELPVKSPLVAVLDEDRELARLARALGHPVRVTILRHLNGIGGCLCGQLVDVLPLAQSTISQHLKKLKEAGWIEGEIDGPRTCYCVNPSALERFAELAETLRG